MACRGAAALSLFDLLNDDGIWDSYLMFRENREFCCGSEFERTARFIVNRRYRPITEALSEGTYTFMNPRKRQINKMGTDKKRTVYTFPFAETMVLKVASYTLYSYDGIFGNNLFSYRPYISPAGIKSRSDGYRHC